MNLAIKTDLAQLANKIMVERGLEPEFSKEELEQLSQIKNPAPFSSKYEDLRQLLWCSIDNDDSRDLDQLTYAEKGKDGKMTLWVAVADVDALVKKNSPIDDHASANTSSIYTPAKIFPMLPEKLSTNFTSLNENEDRAAMVVKIEINKSGDIENSSIFQAMVHNYAKLTYNAIGDWLEGEKNIPDHAAKVPGLEKTLKIQHEAAQILKRNRQKAGALTLQSSEAEVKIQNDDSIEIHLPYDNYAHQLIEEFMVAANRSMAQHFNEAELPNLRRIVRTPKYWDKIVEIASDYGESLPQEPNSKALEAFLVKWKDKDPDSFPDLSLTVIKLLGRGEYFVEDGKENPPGHFALAITEYTHSTAPNRRFPDLITQRQYKAFLRGEKPPYSVHELRALASHCTKQEDAVMKVQRQLNKSAAAMFLSSQIGETFKGIVTGVNEKGTWVRVFEPAVEGKIVKGYEKLRVGQKVTVQLKSVDVSKGFIDFNSLKN